jgi:hypothetical protein
MKYFFLLLAASAMLVAGLTTTVAAGHHYHGHGCGYGMQNISDMDANQDGTLTFDEFSESHLNRLKRHFKMLDADNATHTPTSRFDPGDPTKRSRYWRN